MEVVGRGDGDGDLFFGMSERHRLLHDKILTFGILLHDIHLLQSLHIEARAAVEDGRFARVDVDEHVVDLQSGEGGHQVLDGTHLGLALTDGGAAGGVEHVGAQRLHGGGAGQIHTAEHDAVAGGGGQEGHRDLLAGM